ncbi:Retron-type reverse transcriptase [Candidatus Magnetoovum chiemensis]|nr:Retron-type reverse transcriptase [Candidatus Magnetoovum chiemensis]
MSNGIDFLGYIIKDEYLLVRRRVVNNLKTKLDAYEEKLIAEKDGVRLIRYNYEAIEKLRAVLASYFGHLKWANTYNLKKSILAKYKFLHEFFSFENDEIVPLYKYCEVFPSVKSQYLYYSCKFRGSVIFFQVGCFFEFYGRLRKDIVRTLSLKKIKKSNRGAVYGFPLKREKYYLRKAVQNGCSVVIIRERDRYLCKVKQRKPFISVMLRNCITV